MTNLDTLLAELSVILPDFSTREIILTDILDFNLHDLQTQFKLDLIYTSFFSMLEVELKHKIVKEENAWQDMENELFEYLRTSATEKLTEKSLKVRVESDPKWKATRDKLATLQYKLGTVSQLVKDLNRKGIALNVLTAHSKAEIGAGIQH
jgi:hypothetical protein